MHVSTFFKINGVGKPQKFSSELEQACPSAKLFHLEQFTIYVILYINSMDVKAHADVRKYMCKYVHTYTHIHTCTLVMPQYEQAYITKAQNLYHSNHDMPLSVSN